MTKNFTILSRGLMTCALALFYFVAYAQIPAGYYTSAEGKSGDELKSALYNIIKGHVQYPYTSSSTDVWDILKETDRDPDNPENVVGIYSNFSMNAALEYNSGDGWSREHVWAKSRGDFGTTAGAGTDVHHLRVADISTNSARSNRTFAECSEQYIDGSGTYQGATESFTSSTEFIWKPRAVVKGDIARMIFYMATRYEGFNGEPDLEIVDYILDAYDKSPLHGRLSELLAWHNEDPVDDAERQRNDIIYSYQQNRNPFIDHPEYVASIWGGTTTDPTAPSFTSLPTTTNTSGELYTYNITTTGGEGVLTITATQKPAWLSLTDNGNGTALLSGTSADTDTGDHPIALEVTDGVTTGTQSYTLNVSSGSTGSTTELFISEYIEGSSYNKALEIANFTGADVDLSAYTIHKQTNGSGSWSSGLALTGILPHGDVFVVAHTSASAEILAQADITTGVSEMTFNGNDALALFKGTTLLDMLGVFNDVSTYAQDVTMVRNASISSPNSTYTTAEWDNYATDTFVYLGAHTVNGTTPYNEAPTVSISSPADNASFTEGDVISIAATATDSDGSVAKVVFYEGSNLLGEDISSPYSFNWSNAAPGSYTLTAVAHDDQNATATSSAVNISVETVAVNNPPAVSITNPADGAVFAEGDPITVDVSATDSDGSIARVEFYSNNIKVGEDLSAPYTISLSNTSAGSYSLTAIATDNESAATTSSAVNITVEAPVATNAMVSSINLSTTSKGKNYEGEALIYITSNGVNLVDAYVAITWTNNNGYVEQQAGYTGGNGILFKSSKLRQNDFTVTIDQVTKSGYDWDKTNSEVTKSTTSKTTSTTSKAKIGFTEKPVTDEMTVYPNPFEGAVKIKVTAAEPSDVIISVYNMKGERVEEHFYSVKEGVNELTVGRTLAKGIFVADVLINGRNEMIRIIKN